MTPAGIEPATFRFVAQHLKHCATVVPQLHKYRTSKIKSISVQTQLKAIYYTELCVLACLLSSSGSQLEFKTCWERNMRYVSTQNAIKMINFLSYEQEQYVCMEILPKLYKFYKFLRHSKVVIASPPVRVSRC